VPHLRGPLQFEPTAMYAWPGLIVEFFVQFINE
jgi:hypothetical protein